MLIPHSFNPLVSFVKCFLFLSLFTLLFSCSKEESPISLTHNSQSTLAATSSIYKGIFANSTGLRGVFELTIPGGTSKLEKIDKNASGKIILSNGEIFEAYAASIISGNKSSGGVKVIFDSEDLTFTFSLDENGAPVISDVVFKNQAGAVIAEEHTADTPVTPVTGTYQCTNCQDQNTSVEGIPLNNEIRTFNMLLTTADGSTKLSIQALVGILVETELVVNESCTTYNDYTFCFIKNGNYPTDEALSWSGIHRYKSQGDPEDLCSGISGNFNYNSSVLGSIEGIFKSDNYCPNNTYFVSPSGSDKNTGLSPHDPFKSIAKINTLNLQGGDAVLFEGGKEHIGNIMLDKNDGNNNILPLTISSYGTGKAIIKAGDSNGIYGYNTAGVKIDNLIISGSGRNLNKESGIYFYNDLPGDIKLENIEITNCEVSGFRNSGIVIGAWNGNSGFSNVLIENNKVHDILDAGISSFGHFSQTKKGYAHSNITVRNCEVFNIIGYSKGGNSGNGIVLSDVQHSLIEYSTVYDSGSGNTNCGGPVGIWYWDSDQVIIQHCEVYNMSSGTGCDGGGFDMDGGVTNGIMQYNYSHNNDGAGYLVGQFTYARPMSNITVRYNISVNDAATNGGSVYIFNGDNTSAMKNIFVHNNTFYLSEQGFKGAATIKYSLWKPVKENINFYNNILIAQGGADFVDIPVNYDGKLFGNLYYSTGDAKINYKGIIYNSLEHFRSTGNEIINGSPVGYQGNPLLTNAGYSGIIGFGKDLKLLEAYKISSGSPAISTGTVAPFLTGDKDFYGNAVSSSNSKLIGAHKY